MLSFRLGGLYKAENKKYVLSGKLRLDAETLEFLARIPAEGVYLQVYRNDKRSSDKHPHYNAVLFVPDEVQQKAAASLGSTGTIGVPSDGFDTPPVTTKAVGDDDLPF